MFAVAYGANATRKSNLQTQIYFSRARMIAMFILSQVIFLLSLLSNLEYLTTIILWKLYIFYIYIYLLTAIGLSSGGSTHLHTNNT
jgi:ABC-type antimicrobial peptide transport system permease subunit